MRRHAEASSAGSNHGVGRGRGGVGRLALLILGAVCALCLIFGASSAFAATPEIKIDTVTPGFNVVEISGEVDPKDNFVEWFVQISTDGGVNWQEGYEFGESPRGVLEENEPPQPLTNLVQRGLTTGTTYQVRLALFDGTTSEIIASPGVEFTTKAPVAPSVTIAPVTAITINSAHFAGTVNASAPAGSLNAEQEEVYETKWQFECEPGCPGAPSGVVKPGEPGFRAAEAGLPVSFDVDGLETNTLYEVRLIAINGNGTKETVAERTFSTLLTAPIVKSAPGASDGQGGYVVEGIVNPLGSTVTDCHFEYGPTANYVFQAPCSPTPVGRTEVQELSYQHASEGQFRLVFRGQETGDLNYQASAATVEAALKGLSTVGPNGIASVTPVRQNATITGYIVTFAGPLAEANLPRIGFKPGTDPLRAPECCGHPDHPGSVVATAKVEGGNSKAIVVEAHLTGLTPGATYHVQLVATTGGGTTKSGDQIFVPIQEPAQPPCSNEALRQENNSLALPECRAYEQVTPASKAGYRAALSGLLGGGSVLYQTPAGNIANSGQGLGTLNYYVSNRTVNGWETIPNQNPAGTLFTGPEAVPPVGVSAFPRLYSEDLRSSYWFLSIGPAVEPQYPNPTRSYLRGPDGRFTLIGTPTPAEGIGNPLFAGSSADLSHVVFSGTPSQPGLLEFVGTGNGAPRRVDLDHSGQPISECAGKPVVGGSVTGAEGKAVSKDGRTILFVALGGCPAGPAADEIWARVDGTTSYDASESHCTRVDCNAPAPAHYAGAARDGSSVFFTTKQQLLNSDTDQAEDLYVYHLPTAAEPNPSPVLSEVSGTGPGANTEEGVSVSISFSTAEGVTVSADGSTAIFVSPAVLAVNKDAFEETAQQGKDNLYVWRRDASHPEGQVTFVGGLISDDIAPSYGPGTGAEKIRRPEMTPDGRYVVFNTASPMVPTDTDEGYDVYRYDTQAGQLTRVSTGPLGTGGNADGFNAYVAARQNDSVTNEDLDPWPTQLSITDNGQAVVFQTSEGLVPRDGNGATDIYLWKNGRVTLISSGASGANGVSEKGEFAIDASGQDIYFVTGEALTPTDGDSVTDVYDARVGGGFSAAEATGCSGESCQPAGSGTPSSPSPATNQARAPESPPKTPKSSCPRGKVLKKGKCVKQHKKQGKHHKKHKGKRGAKKHGGAK